LLGSRVDRLPPRVRRGLSLERRADFAPLRIDAPAAVADADAAAPHREQPR
jgi:hypothetical protein